MPAVSVSRSHDRVAERGPYVEVNHSSLLTSSNDELTSSLTSGIPMCGPTPKPRVRTKLNPAAEGFVPTPGMLDQLLQQVSQSLLTWHQGAGCSKDQPWLWRDPMHGSALGLGPSSNLSLQVGCSGVQPKAVDPTYGSALGLRPSLWTLKWSHKVKLLTGR